MTRPKQAWVWRQVWWPRPFDPDTALELLNRIAADRQLGELVFEARASHGEVRYLVGTRPGHTRNMTLLLGSLVPGVRLHEARVSERQRMTVAGHVTVSHHSLALNVERVTAISRAILAGLAMAKDDADELVLQVVLGGRLSPQFVPDRAANPTESWFDLLTRGRQAATHETRASLKNRVSSHGFKATIRIGVTGKTIARERELITAVLAGVRVAEAAGVQIHFTVENPSKLEHAARPWSWLLHLSARELVGLLAWPIDKDVDASLPGHPSAHPRVLPPPPLLQASRRPFAETTAPGEIVQVGIEPRDSLQHTLYLGPTSSGKSTAMLAQILSAVHAGRSVLVIDPKGDLVNDVLARIPDSRTNDVVVIDPTSDRPVGFNPLKKGLRNPGVTADSMLAIFRELSGEAWGPRTNEVLAAALTTLSHYDGATLVMLPSLLTDDRFRHKVMKHVHDPLGLESFWNSYEAMSDPQRAQVIAPAMTRLRQFLMRPQLRAVLGQANPTFDFSDLFTHRRIVLVSLNKGTLGAESAKLLGSLIVGQVWPLILARTSLSPEQRHIVNVFIDEVQDYVSAYDNLDDALSQARGLGVGFALAHQYRRQIPAPTLAGIDANARNKIIFGLNGDDAADLAKQATGLDREDFTLLPRFGVYASLIQDGHATGWFSARTLPSEPPVRDPVELRMRSADSYGQNAKDVEREVLAAIGLDREATPKPDGDEPIGRRKATGGQR